MHGIHVQKIKAFNNGYWIPTAIAVGIIPFITRLYCYTNDSLAEYPWFMPSSYSAADVFLAYKSFALQILMAVMVIIAAVRTIRIKKIPAFDRSFLLLIIYLFWVILSGAFSGYPLLAFGGSFDRFEPVGVVASYVIICICSYLNIDSEDDLKTVMYFSAVCYALMMLIGVMQGVGADPFNTEFVKRLIVPSKYTEMASQMSVQRYGAIAYGTLYNENYMGMYISVFLPVCAVMTTLSIKKPLRITAGILSVISLFVLKKSASLSGWLALSISVFLVLTIRLIISGKKKTAVAVIGGICLIAVLFLLLVPSVRNKVLPGSEDTDRIPAGRIVNIETADDEVVFFFHSGNELHSSFDFTDEGEITAKFWDKDGNTLAADHEDGVYRLKECFEYADAAVKAQPTQMQGIYIASFAIDDHQWPITNCTDGTYYYVNSGLNLVKFPQIVSAGVFSDTFMTGRGAIWNRCIPLLKKHLLIGSGSNLFIIDYQQDDYVRKTYSVGWGGFEYDVKPHNYYLCTWMENGLPAFICIIAFFLHYIVNSARLYGSIDYKDEKTMYLSRVGLGLYTGCLAYMIMALANDSNVCTAPVFWAALGISMSVSKMLRHFYPKY
ncbi:MAG: O-antigen ligase family protein [Lachnospiraceae bacterium]|nr:O-antigen ligase family protein [Lachnospiraceae bacterium]